MRLHLSSGTLAVVFVAGAASMHCGTTAFSAGGGDGGDASRVDASSKQDAGSSGSGSSSASGSGSGKSTPCLLAADCAHGQSCCYNPTADTILCADSCTPNVSYATCDDPSGCSVADDVCCIFPALTTAIGGCFNRGTCMTLAGAELCSSSVPCGGTTGCQSELCKDKELVVCDWTTQCSASSSGSGSGTGSHSGTGSGSCVPWTCPDHYPGACGSGLPSGCPDSPTLNCNCPATGPSVCVEGAANMAGKCIGAGSGT